MALLNVRLSPEDERKAAALREAGVTVSEVVREAIRAEYDRRIGPGRGHVKRSELVAAVLAELPDPPGLPARTLDLADRRAMQKKVAARLRQSSS